MRPLFVGLLLLTHTAFNPAHPAVAQADVRILHTYEVKFRLKGRISVTEVQASDAGQAKKLVETQYGKEITVLSTKRVQ